jgi:hypothetical protein
MAAHFSFARGWERARTWMLPHYSLTISLRSIREHAGEAFGRTVMNALAINEPVGRSTVKRDRRVLRVAGAALAGGLLLASFAAPAWAQPACRQIGHPCEGNQECCRGLSCVVTGPGNAERCAIVKPCPDKPDCTSKTPDYCKPYYCKPYPYQSP